MTGGVSQQSNGNADSADAPPMAADKAFPLVVPQDALMPSPPLA
jgi:hypothetical protein